MMRVGLFVTCLVDLMRPRIGFAALKLLEAAGCEVVVPRAQTCCGQPGYNSGDRAAALALARKVLAEFEDCDYVVVPSGSCTGMIRTHYPDLFADQPDVLEVVELEHAVGAALDEIALQLAQRGLQLPVGELLPDPRFEVHRCDLHKNPINYSTR